MTLGPLERWKAVRRVSGPTPAQRLILLEVAYRDGGRGCWESVGKMATATGLNRRTVQHALRTLPDAGLIERETDRRTMANLYRFTPP